MAAVPYSWADFTDLGGRVKQLVRVYLLAWFMMLLVARTFRLNTERNMVRDVRPGSSPIDAQTIGDPCVIEPGSRVYSIQFWPWPFHKPTDGLRRSFITCRMLTQEVSNLKYDIQTIHGDVPRANYTTMYS